MERRFILEGRLIAIILLAAVTLLPSACGIEVSVSSDKGGLSEKIGADNDQAVKGKTVIGMDGLRHSISGQGSLREDHWVSNSARAYAGVGVNVRGAESYSYGYALSPGERFSWAASKYPSVEASEFLDVINAQYIKAFASTYNAKGHTAYVTTEVFDPGRKASLIGYSNKATASANKVSAFQSAKEISSPDGYIQTSSTSKVILNSCSRLRALGTEANIRIDKGSVASYSDLATISSKGLMASQHIDSASGEKLQANSESALWIAALCRGVRKTADAKVHTEIVGSLHGYDASALQSAGLAETRQTGHVLGTFTSTATADKTTKTKTSNYGTEYDFDMQARKDASGSSVSGTLGYYVDNNSPVANPIQGAVDAAESGDSINLRAGTYRGNIDIQKSLDIKGAGSDNTIVDGQQAGSVFTIGSRSDGTIVGGQQAGSASTIGSLSNSPVIVGLSAIGITNGTGTSIVVLPTFPDFDPELGGGILNFDTLTITDCTISGNTAASGGGIFNYRGGIVNLERSTITGNKAIAGAGIASYYGHVNMESGSIDHNEASMVRDITPYLGDLDRIAGSENIKLADDLIAKLNQAGVSIDRNHITAGGGIASYKSTVDINGGSIDHNSAIVGGGIASYGSALNMRDGTVSQNNAAIGGGVAAILGATNQNGGSIVDNEGAIGGGIAAYGGVANLNGGSISSNTAVTGGGVATYYGHVSLNGSSVAGNQATGAIGVPPVPGFGGGILNYNGTVSLISGSVDSNMAQIGGGIYSHLGVVSGDESIVHDNIPNQIKP